MIDKSKNPLTAARIARETPKPSAAINAARGRGDEDQAKRLNAARAWGVEVEGIVPPVQTKTGSLRVPNARELQKALPPQPTDATPDEWRIAHEYVISAIAGAPISETLDQVLPSGNDRASRRSRNNICHLIMHLMLEHLATAEGRRTS